jgi:hypothetical protein
MVGEGGECRGVGLRGNAGFGSLQAGGDADVPLALSVGLGPGQMVASDAAILQMKDLGDTVYYGG